MLGIEPRSFIRVTDALNCGTNSPIWLIFLKEMILKAGEMIEQLKALSVKPKGLHLIPKTQGKAQTPTGCSDCHIHAVIHVHHTHIYK